jgi:hypothetical protein
MSEVNDYLVTILVSKEKEKRGKYCQLKTLERLLEQNGYDYQLGRINYE